MSKKAIKRCNAILRKRQRFVNFVAEKTGVNPWRRDLRQYLDDLARQHVTKLEPTDEKH